VITIVMQCLGHPGRIAASTFKVFIHGASINKMISPP
jgi:hypothetical protein